MRIVILDRSLVQARGFDGGRDRNADAANVPASTGAEAEDAGLIDPEIHTANGIIGILIALMEDEGFDFFRKDGDETTMVMADASNGVGDVASSHHGGSYRLATEGADAMRSLLEAVDSIGFRPDPNAEGTTEHFKDADHPESGHTFTLNTLEDYLELGGVAGAEAHLEDDPGAGVTGSDSLVLVIADQEYFLEA